MKVKQLLKKLFRADPNADVVIDAHGMFAPLQKVEEGILSNYTKKRGTLHAKGQAVVRLVQKQPTTYHVDNEVTAKAINTAMPNVVVGVVKKKSRKR